MKTTLLAAASALVLSVVAASAAPAVTTSAANVRSGPGARYPVVATLPPGASVDAGCNGGWCAINWNGGDGYVNAGALQFAGGPGVYDPSYAYDDEPDYGVYADPGIYGPGVGFRHRHIGDNGWQRGPGRPPMTARPSGPQPGFTAPSRNFGAFQGAPRMSAPAGLRTGGPSMGAPHMSAPHMSAPHAAGPGIGRRGP